MMKWSSGGRGYGGMRVEQDIGMAGMAGIIGMGIPSCTKSPNRQAQQELEGDGVLLDTKY